MKMSEDIQRIPEDEYRRGIETQQLSEVMLAAEEHNNDMTGDIRVDNDEQGVSIHSYKASRGDRWYPNDGWPKQRVHKAIKALSEIDGTGVDYEAARKVAELRDYANEINKKYDVVLNGGEKDEIEAREQRRLARLEGDNGVGSPSFDGKEVTQRRGAMFRIGSKKYDIKDGVAVRGVTGGVFDSNGNMLISSNDDKEGEYVPFAPQHQEAAKKAIKASAEKHLLRVDNEKSRAEVKAAKKVLAMSGVKIPKVQ